MTQRLTREREKQIREWSATQYIGTANAVMELLAEIDYLRDSFLDQNCAYKSELDALRAENERLKKGFVPTLIHLNVDPRTKLAEAHEAIDRVTKKLTIATATLESLSKK